MMKTLKLFVMMVLAAAAAVLSGEDFFEFDTVPEFVNCDPQQIVVDSTFRENSANSCFKMTAGGRDGGSCLFGPLKLQAGEKYTFEFLYRGNVSFAEISIHGKHPSGTSFFLAPQAGRWQPAGGAFTAAAGDAVHGVKISFSGKHLKKGDFLLVDKMRIADSRGNNLYALRSYIAPEMTRKVERRKNEYVIVFKGNSITRHRFNENTIRRLGWDHESGMAASAAEKDYVHLVCSYIQKELGVPVRPAFANGHKLASDLERVASFKPDMIVIQGGEHPLAARDFSGYEKMLDAAFAGMKKITSNIYCIGLWEPGRRYNAGNVAKIVGIQQKMCKKYDIPYISVEKYAKDPSCRGWGTSAGVKWHPNDKGMAGYARSLFEAWKNRQKK